MTAYPTESYTRRATPATLDGVRIFPDAPDLVRHVFVWDDAPWTMNAAHNGKTNRWRMNDLIAEWRGAFELMARGCQPLAWCNITVDHLTATRRKVDAVACAPAYKAALDGIRRGGVLADDGPDYVRRVTFNAPVYAGRDALIVTVEALLAQAAQFGSAPHTVDEQDRAT